jgi:hypothetical protein
MRRPHVMMRELKRITLAVMMLCVLFVSAFAFDQWEDQKRPPKPDRPVVVVNENKNQKPPPDNRRDDRRNDNKRGRP